MFSFDIFQVISSQSPKIFSPELLELATVAMIHRFHSEDWFQYLKTKIPLPLNSFEEIKSLDPGTGLAFCTRSHIDELRSASTVKVAVRPKLTVDRGMSRRNVI